MELLITLLCIFLLSHGECFKIDGVSIILDCNMVDTNTPIPVIKDGKIISGTKEVSRETIVTIDFHTCTFNDLSLFKNFTTMSISGVKEKEFIVMDQMDRPNVPPAYAGFVPTALSELPNLREVYLDGVNLKLSESLFQADHQLKHLSFGSYNHNLSLPSGFFYNLNNLEFLMLEGSTFKNLSAVNFTGLENVKLWSFRFCDISNLDGEPLQIFKNLKYLLLHGNSLRNIDSVAFSKLYNLIVLHLGQNKIEVLNASTFGALTNLRSLFLNYNSIHRIENGAFSSLKNLKKLDLSNNKLTALDEHCFKGLDNLQYLSLERNLISDININTFHALTKLIQLDLSGQDSNMGSIDLNAFPQFIDLKAKSVIYTKLSTEPTDELEEREVQWLVLTPWLGSKKDEIYCNVFGRFRKTTSIEDQQIEINNLTPNITDRSLVFGNLYLNNNLITSVNVMKNL